MKEPKTTASRSRASERARGSGKNATNTGFIQLFYSLHLNLYMHVCVCIPFIYAFYVFLHVHVTHFSLHLFIIIVKFVDSCGVFFLRFFATIRLCYVVCFALVHTSNVVLFYVVLPFPSVEIVFFYIFVHCSSYNINFV